jgi:hypothetical protein
MNEKISKFWGFWFYMPLDLVHARLRQNRAPAPFYHWILIKRPNALLPWSDQGCLINQTVLIVDFIFSFFGRPLGYLCRDFVFPLLFTPPTFIICTPFRCFTTWKDDNMKKFLILVFYLHWFDINLMLICDVHD